MHILVVGAGPTGLSLARGLARRGIAVRHVDAAAAPATTSRAFGVQARTLEVFDRLGLADTVLAKAHHIRGVAVHLGTGRPTCIDFVAVHPRFPPVVLLPQTTTERLLLDPGRPPERSVSFVRLDGRNAVVRHVDGREERVAADWIVGCDGAHSAVRKAIGAEFVGETLPVHAVLADGICAGLDRSRIHLFPGRERLLAWFPLPAPAGRDFWRAIALIPADRPAPPTEASATPFQTAGVAPLAEIEWYSCFRISSRQVPFLRRDNVLLCGDAAHIHSPAGGQGMNLGIQDAWSLAAALPEGVAAVDAWAATRHAIATRVLRATAFGTGVMFSHNPLVVALRSMAVTILSATPPLRRRVTTALAGLAYPPVP